MRCSGSASPCRLETYLASCLPAYSPAHRCLACVVFLRYVRPLAQALFPTEGEHLDHHHAFMVQYRQGEDLGLDMHTDACDVTLNVCLGKEFTGGCCSMSLR